MTATAAALLSACSGHGTQASGSISGYIASRSGDDVSGTVVVARRDGVTIRGTVAGPDGQFVLAPRSQSASEGPYDIVIARQGKPRMIVRNVPVNADADTVVSTPVRPVLLAMRTRSMTMPVSFRQH